LEIAAADTCPDAVLLWFHGGWYTMGSPRTAAALSSDVARRTGAKVVSVDYRLAPEHPYPAGLQDAPAHALRRLSASRPIGEVMDQSTLKESAAKTTSRTDAELIPFSATLTVNGVEAVIFDLDGVLLDSEQLWQQSKETFVRATGGRWRDDAPRAMLGMSSTEWSRYMHDELEVPLPQVEINRGVVARMEGRYRSELPLLPGAVEAVRGLAAHWPVALASSANREIIDLVLELSGLTETFAVTVSSEEVPRGKPAPDVYLEAARRLKVAPASCVAIEDSSNGLRSAAAAGLTAIAVPNSHYPPSADALALAAATITTLDALTPRLVISVTARSA
jgi:HAD superfamily hydrolase (TIGR01509 family)